MKKDTKSANSQFNILSGDPTKGDGGFGVGALSLDNITPIIIDIENEDVYIDMEALHGRSKIEKKVRFTADKTGFLEDSFQYWIVWIKLDRNVQGPYYSGAGACEVLVSKEERRIKQGYKSMPEHVNTLDKALKNKFIVDKMDSHSKKLLKNFLETFNKDYWDNSSDELKQSLDS